MFEIGGTPHTLVVRHCHDNSTIYVNHYPVITIYEKYDIPNDKLVAEAITALSFLRKKLKKQQKQIKELLSEYNNEPTA